ncbi:MULTISPECIES: quinoprotein relay system zinc metallohydrolase 2 [Mesorhizobium]|uniref:Quinoprotein relay system zinc metallohydrolase 2 n=1 Tax=Mesorhizobium denitrificans TaxID=2294114 RepID=A0A371XC37_9HYPH|nr:MULTISPECIES: quinoprotein relay system zinc metallohydrolase 2 [Mesorhizobium]RFC66780.1 quinoprotein relay system zinc metallohydrolase 2 [Mesorhizobium denitrificans]
MSTLTRRQILGWAASSALIHTPARAAVEPKLSALADGVYAFTGAEEMMEPANQGAICNVGLIVGTESAALIDSGGSYLEGVELLRAVREITDKPLRYLINTHMHPDHIFGNAAFKETGAQIVGHTNLPAALEARGAFYLQSFRRQLGEELMRGVEIIPPTVLVADRTELDLGDRKLDLRAWQPAHTDNDLTVMDRTSGTFFAGDLVFLGHLPTMDGSLLGWMRQLDELAAIAASGVVPGHGPSPSAWPDAIAPERRYFETLASDLRAAIKAGVPLAEAVTTAGQSERAKWKLFDEYNERNATTAYAELEWE